MNTRHRGAFIEQHSHAPALGLRDDVTNGVLKPKLTSAGHPPRPSKPLGHLVSTSQGLNSYTVVPRRAVRSSCTAPSRVLFCTPAEAYSYCPQWLALVWTWSVSAQHRQTKTVSMDGAKAEEPKQSSSGLQFHLHPVSLLLADTCASMLSIDAMPIRVRVCLPPAQLVLINISDHAMRISATSGGPSGEVRVLGCLLGQQAGRVVDISNSFELRHVVTAGGSVMLDEAFVTKKLEQCKHTSWWSLHASSKAWLTCVGCTADKQTFAHLDVVGWYATGADVQETDIHMHRRVRCNRRHPGTLLSLFCACL